MKTRAPVPAVRGRYSARVGALLIMSLLLVPLLVSPASAASGNDEKTIWLQGYVDRTTGQAIQFHGHWYELAGARIVDAYQRSLPGAGIKKGAYVYMRLEDGKVVYLRVFQDIGR